jgi:hypothetical protein
MKPKYQYIIFVTNDKSYEPCRYDLAGKNPLWHNRNGTTFPGQLDLSAYSEYPSPHDKQLKVKRRQFLRFVKSVYNTLNNY